jgi:hypothetical protein
MIPVDLRRLRSAIQKLIKQDVETLRDIHREPDLPTGRTDFHGHIEDDRGPPVAFSQAGATRGLALPVVATFASHQRLLR